MKKTNLHISNNFTQVYYNHETFLKDFLKKK